MSRYKDLPNKTISEKLGISVKTVEAHITSTLKTLRMKLLGKS
jgi:RNA polymerase sigma-70 factor (ECF subfamily)